MMDSSRSVWRFWPLAMGVIGFGAGLFLPIPTRSELARDAVRAELEGMKPPAGAPAQEPPVARLADGRIDGVQITAFTIRTPDGAQRACVLASRTSWGQYYTQGAPALALSCDPIAKK